MSTSGETRRLFPMHPFIVGTEWVEDFSAVDYDRVKESPVLRQQYLDSMALYAMFCRIADTPQFAYSSTKGVFAYDWDEAFDVTDFVIKLSLYNTDAGSSCGECFSTFHSIHSRVMPNCAYEVQQSI